MSAGPSLARTYSVTPEVFGKFLEWLSTDRELAARSYLDIRTRLVRSFVRRGCAHAEELSDRTLDRVALIVHNEPGKYSNPLALSCGVAKKVWLEYIREIVPDNLEPDNIPAPRRDEGDAECELKCLDSCLERLSSNDRDLIRQYHQFHGREKIEARKRLAQEQGGGINKLRLTAFRIRARLHECINHCKEQSAAN